PRCPGSISRKYGLTAAARRLRAVLVSRLKSRTLRDHVFTFAFTPRACNKKDRNLRGLSRLLLLFLCFLCLCLRRLRGFGFLLLFRTNGLVIRVLARCHRPIRGRDIEEHLAAPALESAGVEIAISPFVILVKEDFFRPLTLLALHLDFVGDVAEIEVAE